MNESYLEPGTYAVNKRAGLGSFFIIPEKIIVHNEAFAIIYQAKPKTELKVIEIRKDRKKIDSILYRCAGYSVFMGLGKLPSPPLDLCLGRVQTCRTVCRLKDCKPLTDAPEIVYRSIPIDSIFYPDNDEKKIHVKRVITGQFTPQDSYTLIEGDFHEIESEITSFQKDGRLFFLICKSGDDRERIFYFTYSTELKALIPFWYFSDNSFIPPEYSIIGCRLQTVEEVARSHSSVRITILADPPVAPGEPIRFNARNWPPWKRPKPNTIYEAVRYHDLKAIKSLLKDNPELLNKGNAEGYTPLEFAAAYGTEKIVAYLISQGADINARDNYGSTPLRHAREKKIADLLRKHGARE